MNTLYKTRFVCFVAALLFAACSDDPATSNTADDAGNSDVSSDSDGSSDTAQSSDTANSPDSGDFSDGSTQQGDTTGPTSEPDPAPLNKPLSTADLPAATTVTGWVYAIQSGGSQVPGAMLAGTFKVPAPGASAYGLQWKAAKVAENGTMGPWGNGQQIVWVAYDPGVQKPGFAVSNVKNAVQLYYANRRMPGDLYGHDRARLPVMLQPGKAVVARARGGRGLRLQLQPTDRELWLNPHDTTPPDLRAGQKDDLWHGVPLLNLRDKNVANIHARVLENEHFEASNTWWPGIAPLAVSHIGFALRPKKAWPQAGDKDNPVKITAKLRVEAADADFAYDQEVTFTVIANDVPYRQTFRSPVDSSIQYYGVRPPIPFDNEKTYALALSLHGAGVAGIGQAKSYGPKDWIYIIAPTNRRRFGFDHEEWGHLNDLAALNDATERFNIDVNRRYVTGHSMGGHGTWQFGIHHAGLFAVLGPSAGWDSFYTYGGSPKPQFPLSRARAHSDSSHFLGNITNRAVYVIHGTADNNVPFKEGLTMHTLAKQKSKDVHFHWEEGAGHWWDGDPAPGAACVDWKPLFDLMKQRTRDPAELNFNFSSPGPWYSDHYSYARILSSESPHSDCVLQSSFDGAKLTLKMVNVRTIEIDGKLVRSKGPQIIEINGKEHALTDEKLVIGPTTGKRPGVHGPFNQVMHTPWCWVYDEGATAYAHYAAYLSTHWAFIGNGHGCSVTDKQATADVRKRHGFIHLGRKPAATGVPSFASWDDAGVTIGGKTFANAGLQTIWDNGERLDAAIVTAKGQEGLLYQVVPFSSRSGMPDFLAWDSGGMRAGGYFDSEWKINKTFASGL